MGEGKFGKEVRLTKRGGGGGLIDDLGPVGKVNSIQSEKIQ